MRVKRNFISRLNWHFNEEPGDEGDEGAAGGGGGGGVTAENWRDFLPEDIRNDKAFEKYTDIGAFAKGSLNAMKMVGKDKIVMPETDEQYLEVFNRLGRPEEADGYDLSAPEGVPEDAAFDDEFAGSLKSTMHQLGLTAKQAKGVSDLLYGTMTEAQKISAVADAELAKETDQELKAAFGADVDKHVEVSLQVVKQLGGDEAAEIITKEDLRANPILVKIFSNIANKVLEETDLSGGGQGSTVADIDSEISELMSHPAYTDKKHVEHNKVVNQVFSLREKKSKVAAA